MKEFLTIDLKNGVTSVLIGGIGGALFLYLFNEDFITRLVQYKLGLPVPGAGIALVLGPFLLLLAIASSMVTYRRGAALLCALGFGITYSAIVAIWDLDVNGKYMLGRGLFIVALGLAGLSIDAVLWLLKKLPLLWQSLIAGPVANVCLFVFYWALIFPNTSGRVNPEDVPLLIGLCIGSGLAASFLALIISGPLSSIFERE